MNVRLLSGLLALCTVLTTQGAPTVIFSDDFSSGSGLLGSINGWSEQGGEDKAYNVSSSGELVIEEANGDEKGDGLHAGYFDTLYATLGASVLLSNEGDWVEVSVDFDVFPGTYPGGAVANDTAGLRFSLANGAAVTNAGYGLYIATGTADVHTYQEMRVKAASQASIGAALAGVDLSENSALKNVTLRLTRVVGGMELSGALDGHVLTVLTNVNSAIYTTPLDTLTLSVASRDQGLRVDNVQVTLSEEPYTLWQQFRDAKDAGTEPILPDYSYAGYALGESGIPASSGTVFNVTSYGAVPDDGLSDRAAIEAAIAAAEANAGGIVFFPPGVFRVSEEVGGETGIRISKAHIVLKGSGSGPGGTEIFMREHLLPTDPSKLYSVPHMFWFKPDQYSTTVFTSIISNAVRETFSIHVANASQLQPEMLVQLVMNNPAANTEFLDGLQPWSIWTTTINNGVKVTGERHRIKSISGNQITFYEPIHCNIISDHGWTVQSRAQNPGWIVEDIHFRGNWQDEFVHHQDFIHDSGWSILSFAYGEFPVLRRCRFTDCNAAANMGNCYGATILNCSVEGNRGHSSFASSSASYGTLIAYCADTVPNGTFHGFGANSGAVGTVITQCKNSNRGFDWHASWPYCTLIDACSGGLIGNGGSYVVLPNHMRHLTFWNFNQTAGTVYSEYDWWEERVGTENYSGAKVVNPIIVGYHGLGTTFKASSCLAIESQGTAVEPASLYAAQLTERLGTTPAWLDEARARYDFFMAHGYWPNTSYGQLLYDEWVDAHGLSGPDQLKTADPDADQRNNVFEFAVGGIPTPGSNSLQELPDFSLVSDGGLWLEYIYPRRLNAAAIGLSYEAEFTEDLTTNTWSSLGVIELGALPLGDVFESVTNRMPLAGTTNGFMRLSVGLDE